MTNTLNNVTREPAVEVEVAPDGLRATLRTHAGPEPQPGLTVQEACAALTEAGVAVTAEVAAKVAAIADAQGRIPTSGSWIVAEAKPPIDDAPAQLRMLVGKKEDDGQAAVDHYARSSLTVVAAGSPVAEVVRFAKGCDGLDVRGQLLPRRSLPPSHVTLGKNVDLAPDDKTVLAGVAGAVRVNGLKVWVEPRLDIPSDVDFAVGHVNFVGDVAVGGTVLDLFRVAATGDITVGKIVEAAEINAGGDLIVHGGVAGKGKGRCKAGGSIHAKHVSNAVLEADGDIVVQRELVNSEVTTRAAVKVDTGSIVGGRVTAGNVACVTLGSSGAVATLVEVGFDLDARSFAARTADLVAKRTMIDRVRTQVAPLLANSSRLTAAQKEKATEMIYQADELSKELRDIVTTWTTRLAATAAIGASVTVADRIHPGVTIRFPGLETTLQKELRGPVKLIVRDADGYVGISAINTLTSSVRALDTHAFPDENLDALKRFLAEEAGKK